jgi:hypothetical protein
LSLEPRTSDRALVLGEGFLGELAQLLNIVEGFLGELKLVLEIIEGFLEELKLVLVIVEFFCLLDQQLWTTLNFDTTSLPDHSSFYQQWRGEELPAPCNHGHQARVKKTTWRWMRWSIQMLVVFVHSTSPGAENEWE